MEVKNIQNTLNLSFSKAKVWRRCRQEFHYKYVDHLERKLPAVPLIRGNIIHELIDTWMSGGNWRETLASYVVKYDRLFQEEKELYGDLPGDIERIMENYTKKYQDDQSEYPAVELPFSVELMPGVNFNGRIDAIMRDPSKGLWVMETKTHKRLPDDDVRLMNLQTVLYTWVVPQLEQFEGQETKGVLWNYIRTKPPMLPELLKSGALSQRRNIDSDYDTYLGEIRKHGLNPDDYVSVLSVLEGKQDQFFRRIPFPRPPQDLTRSVLRDLIITAEEIRDYLGIGWDEYNNETEARPKLYRNLSSFQCKNCAYRPLCEAELFDMDVEFVKKSRFQLRTKEEKTNGNTR